MILPLPYLITRFRAFQFHPSNYLRCLLRSGYFVTKAAMITRSQINVAFHCHIDGSEVFYENRAVKQEFLKNEKTQLCQSH